jgi:hypothetical protein
MLTRSCCHESGRALFQALSLAAGLLASSAVAQSPAQQYLRITEIMYNPAGAPAINTNAQLFEYIELKNVSTTTTLNLSNVRLTTGVTFNFSDGTITTLAPGGFVLVVCNQAAFTALYGAGLPIAGEYTGALNNGGEQLQLVDAAGTILDFQYSDGWHPTTDGAGFSLVIINPLAASSAWGLPESWRASSGVNGSPGQDDPLPAGLQPVRVNEVLSHPAGNDPDWIELVNLAPTNVNIGGWFLTDDIQTPKKYRIPDGTILPGNAYLVFSESQFGGANGFGFSEYGEGAYVFAADAAGVLSGFYHGFEFGASPNAMSFGRYLNSQGEEHFVLQSTNTPWAANAAPSVGPVVLAEVMYNPAGTLEEFIELENITSEPVALYCTYTNELGYGASALTNTWRIRDGVEFDFPQGTVLPARGLLLVVGFDPSTNAAQVATVRAQYSIPTNVRLYGPYSGKLSNAGESINLLSPDKPDVAGATVTVPYVLRDKLTYGEAAPWPPEADGNGASLQRRDRLAYGNDPTNWFGAVPTAGVANIVTPPTILHLALNGSTAILTVSAVSGRSYNLQYRRDLASGSWTTLFPAVLATGATVTLTNLGVPVEPRFYRVRAQ